MTSITVLVAADVDVDCLLEGLRAWDGVRLHWEDRFARRLTIAGDTCLVESLVNAHARLGLLVELAELAKN